MLEMLVFQAILKEWKCSYSTKPHKEIFSGYAFPVAKNNCFKLIGTLDIQGEILAIPLMEAPRKLEASQPHLCTWEGDGATNPGSHFQVHEGQRSHQE